MEQRAAADPVREGEPTGPGLRPWMIASLVGLAYLALQILVNDFSRALEWDEATYLIEVVPGKVDVGWSAHRARGMAWFAWPVAVWDPSIVIIRSWFALINSGLLAALVWVWWKLIRWSAVLAGLIVASLWLSLFYGPEVAPNLPAALLLATATGLLLRWRSGVRGRTEHFLAATAIALATLIRPSEAVVFGLASAVVWIWWEGGRSKGARLIFFSVGAGLIPWTVDSYVTFGGVSERLKIATAAVGAGPSDTAIQHLRLLGGPLVGPYPGENISPTALAWLGSMIGLGLLALWATRRGEYSKVARLLSLIAISQAVGYIFGVNAVAPRFLLTAYVFLALTASLALPELSNRRFSPRKWALISACALPFIFVLWHISIVGRVESPHRNETRAVGEYLALVAAGESCAFASEFGYPQIQFYSGCVGEQFSNSASVTRPGYCSNQDASSQLFVVLFDDHFNETIGEWQYADLNPEGNNFRIASMNCT